MRSFFTPVGEIALLAAVAGCAADRAAGTGVHFGDADTIFSVLHQPFISPMRTADFSAPRRMGARPCSGIAPSRWRCCWTPMSGRQTRHAHDVQQYFQRVHSPTMARLGEKNEFNDEFMVDGDRLARAHQLTATGLPRHPRGTTVDLVCAGLSSKPWCGWCGKTSNLFQERLCERRPRPLPAFLRVPDLQSDTNYLAKREAGLYDWEREESFLTRERAEMWDSWIIGRVNTSFHLKPGHIHRRGKFLSKPMTHGWRRITPKTSCAGWQSCRVTGRRRCRRFQRHLRPGGWRGS